MMRAKMKVDSICANESGEELHMSAVCKSEPYGDDGLDENNTFATFTPSADLSMQIQNPALRGKFKQGQEFYIDFTPAE